MLQERRLVRPGVERSRTGRCSRRRGRASCSGRSGPRARRHRGPASSSRRRPCMSDEYESLRGAEEREVLPAADVVRNADGEDAGVRGRSRSEPRIDRAPRVAAGRDHVEEVARVVNLAAPQTARASARGSVSRGGAEASTAPPPHDARELGAEVVRVAGERREKRRVVGADVLGGLCEGRGRRAGTRTGRARRGRPAERGVSEVVAQVGLDVRQDVVEPAMLYELAAREQRRAPRRCVPEMRGAERLGDPPVGRELVVQRRVEVVQPVGASDLGRVEREEGAVGRVRRVEARDRDRPR